MSTPLTIPDWLTPTLLGLLGVGVLWIIRTLSSVVTTLATLRITLFGDQGDTGLLGRVTKLEAATDDHARRVLVIETERREAERRQSERREAERRQSERRAPDGDPPPWPTR
jgi:hypothetical protein